MRINFFHITKAASEKANKRKNEETAQRNRDLKYLFEEEYCRSIQISKIKKFTIFSLFLEKMLYETLNKIFMFSWSLIASRKWLFSIDFSWNHFVILFFGISILGSWKSFSDQIFLVLKHLIFLQIFNSAFSQYHFSFPVSH